MKAITGKIIQKIISMILCIVMMLTLLPATVMASMIDLPGKRTELNSETLALLSELTGYSTEQIYNALHSVGLMDENGELDLDCTIEIDGVSMTIDEAIVLLENPGTDLNRIAYIDGTPITLKELKTVIEVETALAQIEAKYFSGKTFTPEQLASLESLLDQIETQGIGFAPMSAGMSLASTPQHPVIIIADEGGYSSTLMDANYDESFLGSTMFFKLKAEGDFVPGESYSFEWKTLRGLMPADFFKTTLTLRNTDSGDIVVSENSKIVLGDYYADPSKFSASLHVELGANLDTLLGYGLSGKIYGFIELFNANGFAFSNAGEEADHHTMSLILTKNNAFSKSGGSWELQYKQSVDPKTGLGNDTYVMCDIASTESPKWWLFHNEVPPYLEKTADEIFGTAARKYSVDTILYAISYGGATPFEDGAISNVLVAPEGAGIDKYSYDATRDNYLRAVNLTDFTVLTGGDIHEPVKYNIWNDNATHISFLDVLLTSYGIYSYATHVVMDVRSQSLPLYMGLITRGTEPPVYANRANGTQYSRAQYGPMYTIRESITVNLLEKDEPAPSVVSISAPAGTYYTGQYVPITFEFSEPVDASKLSVVINTTEYTASDLRMETIGRKATAYYEVLDVDAPYILISEVKNIVGLFGSTTNTTAVDNNKGNRWVQPDYFVGVELESPLMKNAVTGITVAPSSIDPALAASGVTVSLDFKATDAYLTRYAAYGLVAPKDTDVVTGDALVRSPFKVKVTNTSTGSYKWVRLYASTGAGQTISTISGIIKDLDVPATGTSYLVQTYVFDDPLDDNTGMCLFPYSTTFTVESATLVDGVHIIPLTGSEAYKLSLDNDYRPTLSVFFDGTPTYTSGTWTSSDDDIAVVSNTAGTEGKIILVGRKIGEVYFTFTADDGGLTDSDTTHIKTAQSEVFTVAAGKSAALVIPGGANHAVTREGLTAQVIWSSNWSLIPKASLILGFDMNFTFSIDLYKGNHTAEELSGLVPVKSYAAENTAYSFVIPGEMLTELSLGHNPAYTVQVSMPHPTIINETLSAVCYIIVLPTPPVAKLTPPDNLYLLDDETRTIGWKIDDYKSGHTEGDLSIVRISTGADGQDTVSTILTQSVTGSSGSYNLKPAGVTGLKDTYMVSLRVRNSGEEAYSNDSYPLYVYNRNALKLEVDGKKVTTLTMDNESAVSGWLPRETTDILALREELALIEYIGINYKDYSWNQLKDGIKWETSSDTVSINYKQAGLYANIDLFKMDTYLPETKMALSSITDGNATITATHANTGMSAAVNVDVHTLREKFYLFRFSPAMRTEISYTDGRNRDKTVYTNNEGVLALYEPDGIASDVRLKAKDDEGCFWLGTIYHEYLLSGERDATKLQLYPLNTFKLRQAAKVEIFIKKPDGSPFVGEVTLRGGVYKNGGYCQDAFMVANETPTATNVRYGPKDKPQRAITDSAGRLTVYMDSTQFWSAEKGETNTAGVELSSVDALLYVFELRFVQYYPTLVYSDGNFSAKEILYSTENIINLEAHAGYAENFISTMRLDYKLQSGRLVDVRGKKVTVGPNANYSDVDLVTTMMLWKDIDITSGHELSIVDEFMYKPASQKSEYFTYPFSSIPLLRNTLNLTKSTVTDSGWVAEKKSVGIEARLTRDNVLVSQKPLPQRVTDVTYTTRLQDTGLEGILVQLKEVASVRSVDSFRDAGANLGNYLLETILTAAIDVGNVDVPLFKMLVTPGENATEFDCFIWAGINAMGLPEIDYAKPGVFYDTKFGDTSFGFIPGPSMIKQMNAASKNYMLPHQVAGKVIDDSITTGSAAGSRVVPDFGFQIEGYFEAKIQYNYYDMKWEFTIFGGGFAAGLKLGVEAIINLLDYGLPVPITLSATIGAALVFDFKAAVRYSPIDNLPWAASVTSNKVNDYLIQLRLNVYTKAFVGVGLDYSAFVMKFGVFGDVSVDFQTKLLLRDYLKDSNHRLDDGEALAVVGELGIKICVRLLMFSLDVVIASIEGGFSHTYRDWDKIGAYWANNPAMQRYAGELASQLAMSGLTVVSMEATMDSQDYIDDNTRSWNPDLPASQSLAPQSFASQSFTPQLFAPLSIDIDNGLATLQTNAYPYSMPIVSSDGQILLYASDVDDLSGLNDVYTRIYATRLTGGLYPQGMEIPAPVVGTAEFSGYGDSNHAIAGSGSFAVSAWVRQNSKLTKADSLLSVEEQSLLMNGTEIVASVYNGTNWISTRLTDNALPDIAPVVATNGDTAIVAWRSVYTGDPSNLFDFSMQDDILYSIYDKNTGTWSEAKPLYNGTSGAIMGLGAAMLSDGTAAVTYSLDTQNGDINGYEIGYTIIDQAGDVAFCAIITHDRWLDENPQITVANFGAGDERFVLGWHNRKDDTGSIRLAAIYPDGSLSNNFIDSTEQVSEASDTQIGGTFRFVKTCGAGNDISALSVVWAETALSDDGSPDHGILRAVKFTKDETTNAIGLSAALDVAEMPDHTMIDHFDAYAASTDGKTIKVVIQGTEYKAIDKNNPSTYTVYTFNGTDVYIGKDETKLFTATETYQNKVRIDAIIADYENLSINSWTPVQFTVVNTGFDVVDSVEITLDGESFNFNGLDLHPNGNTVLTCWYLTGNSIKDLTYTLVASFGAGSYTDAGIVHLDFPDLGISGMKITSEELGIRTVQITLYNASDATLAGNKGRNVSIGISDDSNFGSLLDVSSQTPGVTVNADKTLTISGEDSMALIDEGAYTFEISFDMGAYVAGAQLDEMADQGLRLYAYAVAIEKTGNENLYLNELYWNNNTSSILFESPLAFYGKQVSISVEQDIDGNGMTTANVSLHNNSLNNKPSGNLVASLLDGNGDVLEQQQTYTGAGSLIQLDGEETKMFAFTFGQTGSRVVVSYGDLVLDSDNANLSALSFEGLAVQLTDFVSVGKGLYKYTVTALDTTLTSTIVSFVTENPDAVVKINGITATGSTTVPLSADSTVITIEVTAPDGTVQKYVLTVTRTAGGYIPPTPEPDDNTSSDPTELTVIEKIGLTVETPAGATPVLNEDGSMTLPAGGTIRSNQGVSIKVPAGTVVGPDGKVTFAVGSGGATLTHPSGVSFMIDEIFVIMFDETVPLGYYIIADNPFEDVKETDWFYDYVMFAYTHGLMKGTSADPMLFSPNMMTTRGMVVTMMYRMEEESRERKGNSGDASAAAGGDVSGSADGEEQAAISPFSDVTPGAWYYEAVLWAAENSVVHGYGNGKFGPEDEVTREQMAVLLVNYVRFKGFTLPEGPVTAFSDEAEISAWAIDAVKTLQAAGILNGRPGNIFDPQGTATRAEVATIFVRFIETCMNPILG